MDQEQIRQYEAKVSSWLSKQSFIYQLFYGWRIVGVGMTGIRYFLAAFLKLIILLVIVSVIGVIVFLFQHNTKGFAKKQSERIQKSLRAETVSVSKIKGGFLTPIEINAINCKGSEESFFKTMRFTHVQMDLGNEIIWDKKKFRGGEVKCSKVALELQTENSPSYSSLFQQANWFQYSKLTARSFECSWGAGKSAGLIKKAKLEMIREENSCQLSITGGTLSYSWLEEIGIEKMVVEITPEGFTIKEALLRKEDTLFMFNLESGKLGNNPQVSGSGYALNLYLHDLFPEEYHDYLIGVVDFDMEFQGGINNNEGLNFTLKSSKGNEDVRLLEVEREDPYIKFQPKMPMVKTLLPFENTINFRRLIFDDNQWEGDIRGGEFFMRDVLLKNQQDLIRVAMEFTLRFPNTTALERHFYGECTIFLHSESFRDQRALKEEFPVREDSFRHINIPLEGHITTVTSDFAKEILFLSFKK